MITGICLGDIAIDSADANKLRAFYAELLGWERCELWDCPAVKSRDGIVLLFMEEEDYVRPVWPEQTAKQQKQMHFNFQVDDLPAAVAQAEAIGAVKAGSQYGGEHFVTMLDPDGHPFCLCVKGND